MTFPEMEAVLVKQLEFNELVNRNLASAVKTLSAVIDQQLVHDERLTRMELLVENYIRGLKNGGSKA